MKLAKLPNGEPEIFYTIQGEGINSGRPSIFIRLSLCNLHCSWCDTPYTWNWENTDWKTTSGKKFSKEEQILDLSIPQVIEKLKTYPCKNLVITGGEPLIQQNHIADLIASLPADWNIEIETNGTIIPDKLPQDRRIQYNVSPKLPHSGNSPDTALKAEPIDWFSAHGQAHFKFVISSFEDLKLIQELQDTHHIPANKIILMPQGISSTSIRGGSLDIINHCLEHGYRFSDRLHVHIWGNTRAK